MGTIKEDKIEKIVEKWYNERYDTDWDTLQGSLMKIYKIIKSKPREKKYTSPSDFGVHI